MKEKASGTRNVTVYINNKADTQHFDGKKPIALTEFGGVPFIAEMQAAGM